MQYRLFHPKKEQDIHHTISLSSGEAQHVVVLLTDISPHHVSLKSVLQDGARMHWTVITLTRGAVSCELLSELRGVDAQSSIDWIAHARSGSKQILRARNAFFAPRGRGEMTMKGVAEGTGSLAFHGMIEIGEEGGGTHTHLTQHVLMLDPSAKVDAVPGLEIRTNDVRASHSATVSRVTPEDMFYFEARGIAEQVARRMYIEGFLGEILGRIENPENRKEAQRALEMAASIHPVILG